MVKLLKFSLTEKTMIEQKFRIDKMIIRAETFPINWLNAPKINVAINENQNIHKLYFLLIL